MNLGRSRLSSRLLVSLALVPGLIAGGVTLGGVALGSVVLASEKPGHPGNQGRAFDARIELIEGLAANPSAVQRAAQERVGRQVRDLAVSFDSATGAARTISSHTGYLTQPTTTEPSALEIGMAFAQANRDLLGLTEADLSGYEMTDEVFTKVTGATRVYLRQTYAGLPVYNGQLHFNVNREGRLISVNNAFLPNLARAVNTTTPTIDAATAVALAARWAGTDAAVPQALGEPSEARLMWLPIQAGQARLVWNFQIETPGGEHWYDFTVDAVSGKVWTRFDWVAEASYRVYPIPIESPNHTTPLPPADARQLLVDPHDTLASPFGWHDTDGAAGAEFTIHRGNNTHTWTDNDGDNLPPPAGTEPDCGAGLLCDFPINLAGAPSTYRPASVTNLFYWNNIVHDVLWHYGFDEAGGNFQVNNYGNGGLGNDDVMSLSQAAGSCNAFFSTPPDGQRPRMRVLTCGNVTPARDGSFDNGLVTHEYGHGVSNRLVGGPSNVSCLQNAQQPGEGWSDWYALVLTARPTDTGPMPRGFGTYILGQPATGAGGRTQRYSTDPAVNTWTFASIASTPGSHGIGSVWAQGIWEVYWKLVDAHGFDPDVYDSTGDAGNQRALLYVTEGLKNTACGPSFLNARDGILQAAMDNHGGEDVCRIWQAFAAFGLGVNASTPGPSSTTGVNGFETPSACGAALICANPNLAIPNANPTGATSDLVLPAGGTLTDLNVTLKVTHTWVGDLVFQLTKVGGGPTVTFFDRPGVPATANGCPGDDVNATLDDEAASPVETQCAGSAPAISGTFTPNDPLSAFDGQTLAGTWRLTASDLAGIDTGTLTEWCLAPTVSLPSTIFSDGFESGDTSAWSGASSLLP